MPKATGLSREEYERAILDIMREAEARVPELAGVREEVHAAYKAIDEMYQETVRVMMNRHKAEQSKKPYSDGVSLWWFLLAVVGTIMRKACDAVKDKGYLQRKVKDPRFGRWATVVRLLWR